MSTTHSDEIFSEKIRTKIDSVKHLFELMPGVVIIHNLHASGVVYMSTSGLHRLNVTLQELQDMGADYYRRFFNEDDAADYVPKVLGMLERNNDEETVSFFHQIRAHENEPWQWHVCGIRIFMRDDEGEPVLTITVATPIDGQHYYISKIERMLEEKITASKNAHLLALLTNRERQILKMMAKDDTSKHIAGELSIAEDTVKTHRRNIKRKLGLNNQYDLLRFAQTFDIV
jgi:DNA-binding CsgD family transcriptional regulator